MTKKYCPRKPPPNPPKEMPSALVYCRIMNPAGNELQVRGEGYQKCLRCEQHIECVRWIEKELWNEGINIVLSNFSSEKWTIRAGLK